MASRHGRSRADPLMSIENLETVLNALVPFVQEDLERLGYTTPVGCSLDTSGDVELHMPRGDEPSSTDEILSVLRQALRHGARSGAFRATGLSMDVNAELPSTGQAVPAIAVHLEAPGESLMAFIPYTRSDDGEVEYDDVFFGPAEPEVFAIEEAV